LAGDGEHDDVGPAQGFGGVAGGRDAFGEGDVREVFGVAPVLVDGGGDLGAPRPERDGRARVGEDLGEHGAPRSGSHDGCSHSVDSLSCSSRRGFLCSRRSNSGGGRSPRSSATPSRSASMTASVTAVRCSRVIAAPCHRERSTGGPATTDRKSTRLNSSHVKISYAVFCLKKKKTRLTQRAL